MKAFPEKEIYTADDLTAIIALLRDPENGCPWDKVQTHQSIRMNFLEEAYEAVDAIDLQDPELLCEELGDVLMQVVFHTQIEQEAGHFTWQQVCDGVCRKLIERHPHIFGGDTSIKDWDALKNKEKGRTTLADELNTVPATLPALMYAQKMQKRAARKGAFAQTAEDAAAALKAAERGWEEAVPENAAERAGALLFAAANAMRLAGVDAEEALTFASGRFRQELLQKTEDSDEQERPATV